MQVNYIELVEKKINEILTKFYQLKQENILLKRELEKEKQKNQHVRIKVEKLLQKIEELNIDK
ncbi:hypothetical protein SAMN04488516_10294 [Desulfonauticus submarinus]|uniref:Cell division protein ZapB n=1 Tax=Desulfonauticus submarinus TaxID=206665 RepID=A0A1H0B9Y3_9BACT|nr:hypothetical protein [Desulfonauticus submarinus]SDN42437.1 hypothetical protein SAMN04488516_10294 [Desulfonauticus submarinus]